MKTDKRLIRMRITLTGLFLLVCAPFISAAEATNLAVSVDGVVYSNVTWGTVTPVSATVFHSSGIAVVPLEKLPSELQQQFNFDPEKAAAFRTAEKKSEVPVAARFEREETSKRLGRAIDDYEYEGFDLELRLNHVDHFRWRYRELMDLKKRGHKDYQAAVGLFIEACKRAIERHYQLKQEKPEYEHAKRNFDNFKRSQRNTVADNARLNELSRVKSDADAYYLECQRLADQARLAWSEGVKAKELADNKRNPPPPKPKKPAQTDPYLVEDR